MGKVISIFIGLICIALGVLGLLNEAWRGDFVDFVQGGLIVMALLVGLVILVFGLSELRAGSEEPPVAESPAEQPSSEATGQGE